MFAMGSKLKQIQKKNAMAVGVFFMGMVFFWGLARADGAIETEHPLTQADILQFQDWLRKNGQSAPEAPCPDQTTLSGAAAPVVVMDTLNTVDEPPVVVSPPMTYKQ